ncbi:MAG: phage integrase SAM-like domain-containing protein [Aureibaculum sp.]|nr:phage integrase SAM-like domain-containing protein [Aureibaculum sp.]
MATIKYRLHSKSRSAQIYLRLSISRAKYFQRKTGLSIDAKNWSKATGFPKQNDAENKNLTSDLRDLSKYILDKLNDANGNGIEVSGDWLSYNIDLHFKRINESNKSELLTDAIQSIIDTADVRANAKGGIGLSKSRINSYVSLKNILKEYQKNNRFKVKDVNVKFAYDFLKYLLHKENYSKSYALKKITDLKTVCYNAEFDGIETSRQLKKIKSSRGINDNVIYLTPLELDKIKNASIPNESLQNARKWLLLGCNLGQRGGDLLNLTESNFVVRNGLEVIELKQQKTDRNITIPVLQTTKDILETGLPYKISIQKLNNYIKDVCRIAEINEKTKGKLFDKITKRKVEGFYLKWKLITSHVCRRSFATNQYGILPVSLIMQITAHSTEKMFLNYIGKNSLDYAQQIADFYNFTGAKKNINEPQLNVVKNVSNN